MHDGNAVLQIAPGGSLSGYGNIYENFGGASVNNAGNLRVTAGQTMAISTDSVTLSGGTTTVPTLAILQVSGQLTQTGGSTTVNGNLNLSRTYVLQGGVLEGNGIVNGSVDNSGGDVNPGDGPGLLSIIGNYEQDAAGN